MFQRTSQPFNLIVNFKTQEISSETIHDTCY